MNKPISRILLPVGAIAILLMLVAWMAGFFSDKLQPGLSATKTTELIDAVQVRRLEVPVFESVAASIRAKQATVISSRILARIESIDGRAGDRVEKGQLLIKLEQVDLQSRSAQARSRIDSIDARIVEAEKTLKRAQDLSKRGVLSASDFDKATANYDALVADRVNALQSLKEADASLGFAELRAPINGRIVDRFAEPGDTAQPGAQLLSIYNPLSLRVEGSVREKLAMRLSIGQALTIEIPSIGKRLEAEIEEIVPAGNSGSRSFLIKSRLEFTEGLLPGMYARVIVPVAMKAKLILPADRVAVVGQLNVVWVDNNGVIERRFIRTGKMLDDGNIEVISGLEEGDSVLLVQAQ